MSAKSERRKAMAKKKAEKKAAMRRPGEQSKYALKKRGTYPLNSPYRTRWQQYA